MGKNNSMNKKKKSSKGESNVTQKIKVNPAVVVEIAALFIGMIMSVRAVAGILVWDKSYAWHFAFSALAIVFIAVLLIRFKKPSASVLGVVLLVVFLIVGGFDYIVCTKAERRKKRLSEYEYSAIIWVELDGTNYLWDGHSVTYNAGKLNYLASMNDQNGHDIKVLVNGFDKVFPVYTGNDSDKLYIEFYEGDFMILKKY